MARVVVVGGGFAGLSAAARLAKLRHEVTLVERGDELGGRLRGFWWDDHAWQLYPETVTLPGVFRDLFRKSGRQLDRVLDLVPAPPRRHVFVRGRRREVLDLPFGMRGDQSAAVEQVLGTDQWSPWVDSLAPRWDALRRRVLDEVYDGILEPGYRRQIRPRRSLRRVARRELRDRRLRSMVLDAARLEGDDPMHTPGVTAVWHYVERNFGRWSFDGGMPALADALTRRMGERKVDVRPATTATDVCRSPDGRITGVETDAGAVEADVVVWCAPDLPVSTPEPALVRRIPAPRTLLRLSDDPGVPDDVVLHAERPLRVWRSGPSHWVIENRAGGDALDALAEGGLRWHDLVESRRDLAPRELVLLGHDGWAWRGWHAAVERPGAHARDGLFFGGAHAHPGASLELIGLATAAIASHLGEVPRR